MFLVKLLKMNRFMTYSSFCFPIGDKAHFHTITFINFDHQSEKTILSIFEETNQPAMRKRFFTLLSKINKKVLPSYSKQQLDLAKASKLQKAIIGWRLWVTKNAIG